jgi:hypothetical protein
MISELFGVVLVVLIIISCITLTFTIRYYYYMRHLTVIDDRQPSEIRLGLESYPSIPKIPKAEKLDDAEVPTPDLPASPQITIEIPTSPEINAELP